ncbi:hypothetical protein PIECOFPK_02437 [Mycovorax composti]|jgi:F5/8 type C domain.|uniref:F5/8 type C domain-containing protein n=2 Tax=Chitinophagaceae TaxID=563835 RepID=A0ABZ2EMW9_9BACT
MKKYSFLTILALMILLLSTCSKMDDTYKEYLNYGQSKYPGKPVQVKVLPGYNRLILTWTNSADPKVTHAKVYWNNRADSVQVPIDPSIESVYIPFNNMPEGPYVFEIYTFDKEGNSSIKVEAIGRVYGDVYKSRLLSRPINDATVVNDSLNILWGSLSDTTIIGTEVKYIDNNDEPRLFFIDKSVLLSMTPDFSRGDIEYRTVYLPVNAIDTFYTDWVGMYVKGQRYPLPKDGWVATASSFDTRPGSSYRPPSNLIDNNPSTLWVNQISPQTYYPHWAAIDMGDVKSIEGFIVRQRPENVNPVKDIELYTSMDGVNWTFHMKYTLENRAGAEHYIDLPETTQARHIKLIALNDYGNSNNVALAEFGAYAR